LPGDVKHRASPKFWQFYSELPEAVRRLADGNYELLKADDTDRFTLRKWADCAPFELVPTTAQSALRLVST